MNNNLALKIQAYLDGELSGWRARRLERAIDQDPAAQQLLAELRATKSLLTAHEPEAPLAETREFYWSRIEREILREGQPTSSRSEDFLYSWRRYLAPLAGFALVCFLAVGSVRFLDYQNRASTLSQLAEVENLSEHLGSFSFRSQSANMFVVWVYEKDAGSDAQPERIEDDEFILQ